MIALVQHGVDVAGSPPDLHAPQRTMADRVADELRDLLISGRLAPGQKLSIRRVADSLGVSMMPVREAIGRLAADGALEVLPGKAVRVPLLPLATFRDLTDIRLLLEGQAVALAATEAREAEIATIMACEAGFRRIAEGQGEPGAAVLANRDFHFAVYAAAHRPMLVDLIERLWIKAGPILNLDMRDRPERLKGGTAVTAHAAMLAAIRIRDAGAARAALEADIRAAARHIEGTGRLGSQVS